MTDVKTAGILDWLLGRPQGPQGTEDRKQIQAALTKATNEVSRKFQAALTKTAPLILKQAKKVAEKYGIDPLYVQFAFIRPTSNWPQLPPLLKEALEAAQFTLTDAGNVPSFAKMEIPPAMMGVYVDAALTDLADWAAKKMLPALRKQYFSIVEKAAKPQIRVLRRPKESLPALVDAASQVSGYFKYLIRTGRELSPLRLLMFRVITAFS